MANTTNFGWETPDDTDLVKDGAAAIRTLGSAIDTSLVDLKGGTTGQILAKASNTDMDFTWASDATGIQATIFDAKGDLIAASAADTAARLAVGTNGQVLTADSSTATGLKWATASTPSLTWSLLNAGGTALTAASTITVSGISNQKQLLILVADASKVSASESYICVRFNGDTGSNYSQFGAQQIYSTTYSSGNFSDIDGYSADDRIRMFRIGDNGADQGAGSMHVDNADTSGWKRFTNLGSGRNVSGTNGGGNFTQGFWEGTGSITSVSIISDSGSNFDAGTVYILGAV